MTSLAFVLITFVVVVTVFIITHLVGCVICRIFPPKELSKIGDPDDYMSLSEIREKEEDD